MESEISAGFFEMIHRLAEEQQESAGPDRRQIERRPFLAMQRIAPLLGPDFPKRTEFFRVACYDLTREGFSFLLRNPPDFTSLVGELGLPPKVTYMAATVQHSRTVLVHASGAVEHVTGPASDKVSRNEDGQYVTPMVLVGCKFFRRLD